MSPLHLKTVLKQVQNLSLSPLFHSLSLHPLSYVSVSVCVLSVYTWKLKAEVRCLPLLCSPCWFTRWGLSLNSGSFSLYFLVIGLQVGNTYLFFFFKHGCWESKLSSSYLCGNRSLYWDIFQTKEETLLRGCSKRNGYWAGNTFSEELAQCLNDVDI